MAQLEHTMDFHQLKKAYIGAVQGNSVCRRLGNNSHIQELVNSWENHSVFYGPSSAEVTEWLHKGYQQPGLTLDPPIEPVRKRRRLKYGEEGELQLDLMWSGHDYPFLDWTKRDVLPGMRVDVRVNFVRTTDVQVTIDYYRWVLRALVALESAGIDLEVWVSTDSTNIFEHDYSNGLLNHIRVKKEGEQTDLLSWSPMLSPGGYRHLTFLAYILGSDANGKTASRGLGRGRNVGHPWSVSFDPDTNILQFGCPWAPKGFPENEMDLELRLVLAQARRVVA